MNTQNGKAALITGGSRGVGKAVCQCLAKEHVSTLFVNYLEKDAPARSLCTQLKADGIQVHLLKYNLAFAENIKAMFEEIVSIRPRLDYFVHCAALTAFKPLYQVKPNQWDLTLNVSARSFLLCVQACIPLMKQGGDIVAVSSTGSRRYNPSYGALGISKMALEGIVRYLAVELAAQKIRINGIIPGLLEGENPPPFPQWDRLVEETLKRTPAKRLGKPEEVAEAIYFILTKAPWMYGQNIILDGGYCLT